MQIIKSLEIDELPRHILMSFRTESDDKAYDSSPEKFMENLMYRKLYTDYNIGNPWQKIKFYYEMNSYHTQISEDHFEKIQETIFQPDFSFFAYPTKNEKMDKMRLFFSKICSFTPYFSVQIC